MKDLTLPLVQTIGVPFMGPCHFTGPSKRQGYVPPHRSFSEGVSPVKNGGSKFSFLFQVHSKFGGSHYFFQNPNKNSCFMSLFPYHFNVLIPSVEQFHKILVA